MSNDYFNTDGNPANNSAAKSSVIRAIISAISAGFDKLPALSGNGSKIIAVNSGGTALESVAVTGTGSVARSISPTLTTPVLGAATATSVNKVTITAPATSATITIADGKTLTVSNTITLTGADSATLNISDVAAATALAASSGSALVGFIQSGTGAVAQTEQGKLRTVVTDGDFSTYQQAAIGAIGKTFFVPVGATVSLTVPTDVATIAAAITAIARWIIPADATVQIIVPTGSTSLSTPTAFNHPYGARVEIIGTTPVSITGTTLAAAVSGSAGAYSVQINVSAVAGISANDYAIIRTVTGTGQYVLFNGIFKITAVGASTITILHTAQNAAWPTNTMTGCVITVIKSMVYYTGCDGFRIDGPLGKINNIALVGDRSSGTIGLIASRAESSYKDFGRVLCGDSFGVIGFGDAGVMALMNGVIDARYIASANNLAYNLFAQHGGRIMANNCVVCGAGDSGLYAHSGGDIWAESGISSGNLLYGAFCISGGSILMQNGFVWSNVSDGWRASWGGAIRAPSISSRYNGANGGFANDGGVAVVTSSTLSNNNGAGVYTQSGGSIDATSSTMSSNVQHGAYSDGGFIDCPSSTASSNTINGYTAVNGGVILGNLLTGSSNGTYLCSASTSGYIRATNASASGQTLFVSSSGMIDATSATGTPTLTRSAGGIILNTSGDLLYGALTPSSISANGATETGVINAAKNSTYNSESTSALCAQNIADPLKMLVAGYDNTFDYGYIQALRSTSGYKNIALNPNAGNVGIGLVTSSPTARLHLPAGAAGANSGPLKFTSGIVQSTAEPGTMEYNGTNLFFTRSGTTREGVLTQRAVTAEVVVSDTTVTVNIDGVEYKLLAKA